MIHYCLLKYSSQLLIRNDSQCGLVNNYANFWGTSCFKLKGQWNRRNIVAPFFLTRVLF